MRSIEKQINDNKYEMLCFGALKGLRLASKIAKTMRGVTKSDDTTGLDVQTIMIHLIGDEEFTPLVKELCETYTCNGIKIDFDMHFSSHPKDLLPCVGLSLKENVFPFFDPTALETLVETVMGDLA